MQQKVKRSYKIIGLMSGTSLDGLDICYASFSLSMNNDWSFKIIQTDFFTYPTELLKKLKHSTTLSGLDLMLLDKELGKFYGEMVNRFIKNSEIQKNEVDTIASHGQTIFHQPERNFTCQIGCGQSIAIQTGIKTINDFRKKDVLLGGQGAPLVSIGDKLLFSAFADTFLNIGGFANLSNIDKNNRIVAFDICPANILINHFTQQLNLAYDNNGDLAKNNSIHQELLVQLNNLSLYQQEKPHSLGWEWVDTSVLPIIANTPISIEGKIATITEHVAIQIAQRLNKIGSKSVYTTGGGAKNTFLINRLQHYFNGKIDVPSKEIIDFKEALIFGFLGALHLENQPNCLPEVTGASRKVIGGTVYLP
ncbi:MAG: anhydro-N-acetylmuramic acid kinase [Crocinitomicaceae bacterium]|nr:anhydro-N-acetylmuramic acid kinase [Crocinitomicaceae bacterium]